MATFTFLPIGKTDKANIYLRLSIDRNNVFKKNTGFTVNPNHWSKKTHLPKTSSEDLKRLKTDLESLRNKVEKQYNAAIADKVSISGEWLQNEIDSALGKKKKTDIDRFVNYLDIYTANLNNTIRSNNKKGVSKNTIQKFGTLKSKILDFEKHTKKKLYIKDINLAFRNKLIKYLEEVEQYSGNYIGTILKNIKTVCNDAKLNGIETHTQLSYIKGYTVDTEIVFLSFQELELIENTEYSRDALANAKDWLIIGCYIGQRVSDLLTLTSSNVTVKNGCKLIELAQDKTDKRVAIPLHPKVKTILDKRNGEFPRKISDQRFNTYLKEVAKLAGLTQPTKGGVEKTISLNGKKVKRKKFGTYPKWELVSSHICRRSFASNFYGDIPTALLIQITRHSTEKEFLKYIGKSETDHAQQLAEYWTKQAVEAKQKPHLNVVKKAN